MSEPQHVWTGVEIAILVTSILSALTGFVAGVFAILAKYGIVKVKEEMKKDMAQVNAKVDDVNTKTDEQTKLLQSHSTTLGEIKRDQ